MDNRRTEGATLFVVVFVMLLLLSAILAITAQLTLSGRRSVSDQNSTLQAQYAAESTIARAQTQMTMINRVLKYGFMGSNQTGFNIPSNTSSDTISGYIQTLCGLSSMPLASMTTPICGTTDPNSNIFAGVSNISSRLTLFTAASSGSPSVNFINDNVLAAVGGPPAGSTVAVKQAFWARMFGGGTATNVGTSFNGITTQGTVGAVISNVWRKTGDEYEIHLRVPDINVRAAGNNSARSIKVAPSSTEYRLTISRPPLAKYALFTNHHFSDSTSENGCANNNSDCARITFTSNTRFYGPVHSNEQFNFQDNPLFYGPVTSAGCAAGTISTDSAGTMSCSTVTPGAYFGGANFQSGVTNPSALLNPDGTPDTTPSFSGYDKNNYSVSSNPQFNWTPTTTQPDLPIQWSANFEQLPGADNTTQSSQAAAGGLSIPSGVSNMSLNVATITAGGASQKVQQISYTKSSGSTVNLAINASGQVFINIGSSSSPNWKPASQITSGSSSGEWQASTTSGTFNGVVYVAGAISNLNGPARSPSTSTTATSSNTAPSIANFMKLNVTASGDIGITSDLRYENPPCDDDGNCNNESAVNIFGIYSTTGNVNILNKYTCAGSTSTSTSCTRTPSAPPNVSIQGVLMAGQGKVTVDGYNAGPQSSSNRGSVNLVGGIIENYYGAFGLTSGVGYGRNFVYDSRTSKGVLPPAFPTTKNWTSDFSVPIKFGTGAQVQQSNTQYNKSTKGN